VDITDASIGDDIDRPDGSRMTVSDGIWTKAGSTYLVDEDK
jgi:hypothetical protein